MGCIGVVCWMKEPRFRAKGVGIRAKHRSIVPHFLVIRPLGFGVQDLGCRV
jgi:hypothetical protein